MTLRLTAELPAGALKPDHPALPTAILLAPKTLSHIPLLCVRVSCPFKEALPSATPHPSGETWDPKSQVQSPLLTTVAPARGTVMTRVAGAGV